MRAVVQRVRSASVEVEKEIVSVIDKGLLVFVGIGKLDTVADRDYLARKIAGLRIFPDGDKETALSVLDIQGELLLVSQFTLYGDVRKGRRPSYSHAMPPDPALDLFNELVHSLEETGLTVKTGKFGAMMDIKLINDGPYTILIDSKKSF